MSIPEHAAPIAAAEIALVDHLLDGNESAADAFLIDNKLYVVRIEHVTDDNKIQEIVDEFIN